MPGTFASPFASSSLWNTPIDQLDPTYSNPGSVQNQQFENNSLANTWASVENIEFETPTDAPLATWNYRVINLTPEGGTRDDTGGTSQLPTPTNITFGNGSDGWAIFSNPDGIHYWEVWGGSYNAQTNTYQAQYLVEGNYVTGTGFGENGIGAGVRASGASLLGGIVTQAELNSLSIPHALDIELAQTQLEAGQDPSAQMVHPAVSTDTGSQWTYTGAIPMGALFALPPNLDLADAGLTPEGLALAEAYQTYGGYVVDSASFTDSLAQIEGGTTQQINDIFADLTWIRDHLVMVSTSAPVVIESSSSTSLVESASDFYLNNVITGTGPELQFSGSPVTDSTWPGWMPIAVEQTASGYDVAWKNTDTGLYNIWLTDSSGNYIKDLLTSATANSPALEAFETIFNYDLNGDGAIGSLTVVIESSGSTSLVETGNDFYLNSASTGSGPELQFAGSPVTDSTWPGWIPIAVEQTAGGYGVAWKNTDTGLYNIWFTDSSGNYIKDLLTSATANSPALEAFETIFNYDLNGDGAIGSPTVVIESSGSTSLVETGNDFYLNSTSTGSGPELQFAGSAVTYGTWPDWTPIAVEQTASGYDVAWKNTDTGLYNIWLTDSSGNYIKDLLASATANSPALEAFETIFHYDFNGDGITGIVTTIAAGATVELASAISNAIDFESATGSLILDQSTNFSGQVFNFAGNGTLTGSDQLDLKDIVFSSGASESYSGNSTGGVLTVTDGQDHTARISLAGNYSGSTFSLSSDSHGGTVVVDPTTSENASGTALFGEVNSAGTYSVDVSPENKGTIYFGNFTVDAPNVSNGQISAGWHFNFDESNVNHEVTQSYNVSLVGAQPQGTSQAVSQVVSVTIGGTGNDSFVFHPGVGTDIVANATSSDTFELDGFSSLANSNQLSTLLEEAKSGISQSVFSSTNDGHDTTIHLGNHDSITLEKVALASLHSSNFIIS